jgi:basic membrane protein A
MSKDLDAVAKQNPAQQYAIIDAVVPDPNVLSITFKEEDGSFLAGALAAMMTKTHHIAFIGGIDSPLIEKFEAGYTAGARQIDPTVRIDVKYAGSFEDVAAGSELANLLFSSGADIIYTAAGKVGIGAIDAVKTRPTGYIIGVDSNQDSLAPGRVLTSMVKHVDIAVFTSAQAIARGKPLRGHLVLGLHEGAVGLTDFKYTKNQIGPANLARLAAISQAIVAGRISPPATRAQLAAFHPVKL